MSAATVTRWEYVLELRWPSREGWAEVTRGNLPYCERVRSEGTRFAGETRIVKVTTTTEVVG